MLIDVSFFEVCRLCFITSTGTRIVHATCYHYPVPNNYYSHLFLQLTTSPNDAAVMWIKGATFDEKCGEAKDFIPS